MSTLVEKTDIGLFEVNSDDDIVSAVWPLCFVSTLNLENILEVHKSALLICNSHQ